MHSSEVHSNESACRKSRRLGIEQVNYRVSPRTSGGNPTHGRENTSWLRFILPCFRWPTTVFMYRRYLQYISLYNNCSGKKAQVCTYITRTGGKEKKRQKRKYGKLEVIQVKRS